MELTGMVAVGTVDELAPAMLAAQAQGFPVASVPLGGGRYRLTIGAMQPGAAHQHPARQQQCDHHGHERVHGAPRAVAKRPTIPAWVFAPGAVGEAAMIGGAIGLITSDPYMFAMVCILVVLGCAATVSAVTKVKSEIKSALR